MSFIQNDKTAVSIQAGYFLAHEECVRKTMQMTATAAYVTTTTDGEKYVKSGTIYPANDSTAVGIVYEDVDVTTGDMPGSVVLKGTVYEERLPITGYNYNSVTLKNLVSPKEQGWQERSGSVGSYTYADSTDTTVDTSKTYYLDDTDHTAVSDYAAVLNPKSEGWYESDGQSPANYTLSTDTAGVKTKTYYTQSAIYIASAAKTALETKGFVFVTEATVTRP